MKLSKYTLLLLVVIFLLSFFLRFYNISTNPPSLTWDEVAWGYNAYSLGIDGKDEFGNFLPHAYLESFGDFKPPLYAYLDIIPIKLFGLSELAVRFPSAFFGVLTVLLTFFLTIEIFYRSKNKLYYAFAASLLLAISPWHINLSRAAFEANVSQFFIILGIYFFFLSLRKIRWILLLSVVSFVSSLYTFNTARVFVPIIVLVLGLAYFKTLWRNKVTTIFSVMLGILLVIPLVPFLLSPQASLRFREVNIFSDPTVVSISNQEIANDGNSLVGKILHNRRLKYGVSFVSHYFDNFNPDFLFISGDGNPKFSTQDVGQIYLWSMPFLIIGGFLIFRKREDKWWLIPVWLLVGIIPAATARETPHALRIETVIPTIQIIIAYGVVNAYIYVKDNIKNKLIFQAVVVCFILGLFINIFYYLFGYYVHYAREYSQQWQYGYVEAINYARGNEYKYDKIYISDKEGRPYIYYLFYAHVEPDEFRSTAEVERDVFGFVHIDRIGKYYFGENFPKGGIGERILYIQDSALVPPSANVIKKVKALNGKDVFTIYE